MDFVWINIDFALICEGALTRTLGLSVILGYTYSNPIALDPNLVYYEHFEQSTQKIREYTYINTSSDTTGYILKYRIQHLGKSDIQFTFKKRISAGVTGRYYGFMKNIDIFLYQLDKPNAMHSGIVEYRENHNKGNFIVDFRVSYLIKDFKISLMMNNVFNTEYSLRPITIEAPRSTSLQVVMTI